MADAKGRRKQSRLSRRRKELLKERMLPYAGLIIDYLVERDDGLLYNIERFMKAGITEIPKDLLDHLDGYSIGEIIDEIQQRKGLT